MKKILLCLTALFISGCVGIPDKITPVQNFELNKYLGKWYEIARLDHSFERGMEQVSAEYKLRSDGDVDVINRGFLPAKDKWKEAVGKAKFVDKADVGHLKVSFFGPFYGSYVVFELEDNYDYAFVSGPDLSYLWLLSRKKTVTPEVMVRFKAKAAEAGFDTAQLIFVKQD